MKYNIFWLVCFHVMCVFPHTLTLLNNPDSPIWNDPLDLSHVSVVRSVSNEFKLYYTNPIDGYINIATSPDGKNWTNFGDVTIGQVINVEYYANGFTGINNGQSPSRAKMYYRGWVILHDEYDYTESPDGLNWYNINPFSQYGVPLDDECEMLISPWGDVIYTADATNTGNSWKFRMYFTKICHVETARKKGQVSANVFKMSSLKSLLALRQKVSPKVFSNPCEELNMSIYVAFSNNGYNWTAYDATGSGHATPVFEPSYSEVTYEDMCNIISMHVIRNSPTDWEAFYTGSTGMFNDDVVISINYATSTDGLTWNRSDKNPLLSTENNTAWYSTPMFESVVKTAPNHYFVYFVSFASEENIARENEYTYLGLLEFGSDVSTSSSDDVITSKLSVSTLILIIVLAAEGLLAMVSLPLLLIFRCANNSKKKKINK